jgi:periplasmic protein TonB
MSATFSVPEREGGVSAAFGTLAAARPRVGAGLSFSLIGHALILALVGLAPFLMPEALPEPRGGPRVRLYNPPPPPPPPGGGSRTLATAAPHPIAPPAHPTAFVAPVEEPTAPPVESLPPGLVVSTGTGGMPEGVEGGVPGGVPGGKVGGDPNGTGDDPVMDYDRPPMPLKTPPPRYPSAASVKRIEGTVFVEFFIDANGRVTRARVTRSIPQLDEAALAAVRGWLFTPAVKNGRPVGTLATAPVTFMIH